MATENTTNFNYSIPSLDMDEQSTQLCETRRQSLFGLKLIRGAEQLNEACIGNLFEVADFKFGHSDQTRTEETAKKSGKILGEDCTFEKCEMDTVGADRRSSILDVPDLEICEFNDIFKGESFTRKSKASFKKRLNTAISGYKAFPQDKKAQEQEFELDSTAPSSRKVSKDSIKHYHALERSKLIKKPLVRRNIRKNQTKKKDSFLGILDITDLGRSILKSKTLNFDAGRTCLKLQSGIEGLYKKVEEKEQKYLDKVEECRKRRIDSLLEF